jgi:hypothetical protein
VNAENDFAWPFVTLKHLIIEFTNVGFYDVPKVDIEFSGPFPYLKQHLRNFGSRFFFGCPRNSKSLRIDFNTLTHRLIDFTKVVFLRRPESRL